MAARKGLTRILLGAVLCVATNGLAATPSAPPPSHAAASGNPHSSNPNQVRDPNAQSTEDAAILADFEFFALLDLLRDLHLFVETP